LEEPLEMRLLAFRQIAQHIAVHQRLVARMSDTDAQPAVVRAHMLAYGPQPIVPSMTAAALHLDLAWRQIEFVVQDQKSLWRQLEEAESFAHRLPRVVHIGHGLEGYHLFIPELAFCDLPLEASAPGREAVPRHDGVECHKSDVMAVARVSEPGIAEPDQQEHHTSSRTASAASRYSR